MPLIRADRVKESSTSTSTSAFLLNGADSTYRTFASVCAVGDTVYYAIAHRSANEWEVGLGTYSAVNTLTRTTVHASSNANAAVAFSTGTKDVLLALTKTQLETYATLAGTETLTGKTISGLNNTITNVHLATSATGTLPLSNGGTGTTTAQLAINSLAGAVTSGSYLRGNGTNVVMAAIQAADVPTLNQNTTGTASGSVSGTASYVPKFTSTNVVGNSLIYDNGTNIGVGTASPSGRVHISATGIAEAKIEGTTAAYLSFIRSGVNFGYVGLGSPSNSDIYIYNLNSGAVRINAQAVYVTATNLVGINETIPAAQLHVASAAAATKGLIVRGASAQSANLQEWQDNASTAVASIASNGSMTITNGTNIKLELARTTFLWSGIRFTDTAGSFDMNGGGDGLLLITPAASKKALQVRSSASQTANLQEWQNSSGSALAVVDASGNVGIGTSAPTHSIVIAKNGPTPAINIYKSPDGVLRSAQQVVSLGTGASANNSGTTGGNEYGILNLFMSGVARCQLYAYAGGGGYNNYVLDGMSFGQTSAAAGQVVVAPVSAATKGLVVKGFTSQSANLQEWQNSAGTALAAVDAAGALIPYAGIYTPVANGFMSQLFITQQVSEYTQSFYRTLPSVVGDYVEFIEVNDTTSQRYEFSISVVNYPYWLLKRYEFTATWNNATNGVVPPVSISNRNYGLDFDYELETVSVGSYYRRFRIKRTKGTTTNVQAMVLMRSFGDYATNGRTELTGTGTSAYSSYITRSYDYVNPNIAAPPPANYSGSGTPLSLSASSAVTTGSGGGITLQAGNAATTGSGGDITLYTGAGATSGSNGKVIVRGLASNTANLQEWQNNAGGLLSAVNSAGSFTNTGGQSQSEEFGNNAVVSAPYATAIGYGTSAAQLSTAVGWNCTANGVAATSIGDASSSSGDYSVAIGRQASATVGAIAIGLNATATSNGISIGRGSSSAGIMLGYQYAGAGIGYTTLSASADGRSATGAIEVITGDGVNYNTNYSRQHSILGTWATATYASRLGRVQLRVNDFTTDREAIRYESDGANALTSIGGAAVIASTTLAVQPAVSGNKGIVVKGASGQSANLLELQNSSGQIGLSVSVNQFGEATFVNGPRYISTTPEFSAGLWLQFQDSAIDRTNVKMHVSASIGFAAGSASVTALDTYISRGNAGVLRVNAASGAGGSIAITSNTPSAFTADQNNLALTASGFQRLSGTAARNITGIAPPSGSHVDGRMIRLYNVGSFNLTLKHNSTSSTAANRFWNVQAIDIIVGANDYAELIYDATNNGSGAAGWRVA